MARGGGWARKGSKGLTGAVEPQTEAAKLIARARRKARAERTKALFLGTLRARGLPNPSSEYHFDLERRWRFDYAFLPAALAVEQEGLGGRHQFTGGFVADMEKYNTAALLGWAVLRFTVRQMESGEAADWIEAFYVKHSIRECGRVKS